jgi:hypothetical protein
MSENNSFLHPGTFGDTIYAMNVVKLLGGGDVYIKWNGMNEVAWNAFKALDAGIHAGRYNQRDLEFLFPLLEHQSYIKNLRVWRNEPVDYELGNHYKFTTGPTGWQGNQTECYGLVCGIDIHKHQREFLQLPWLDPVKPIKIPGKSIVLNWTGRYIYEDRPNPKYAEWLSNGLEEQAVFLGTKSECDEFNTRYKCNITHHGVSDMLEMARVIEGAELTIGNQSAVLAVAIGLGKSFYCESRKDFTNYKSPHGYGDVWFPRVNSYYF